MDYRFTALLILMLTALAFFAEPTIYSEALGEMQSSPLESRKY